MLYKVYIVWMLFAVCCLYSVCSLFSWKSQLGLSHCASSFCVWPSPNFESLKLILKDEFVDDDIHGILIDGQDTFEKQKWNKYSNNFPLITCHYSNDCGTDRICSSWNQNHKVRIPLEIASKMTMAMCYWRQDWHPCKRWTREHSP